MLIVDFSDLGRVRQVRSRETYSRPILSVHEQALRTVSKESKCVLVSLSAFRLTKNQTRIESDVGFNYDLQHESKSSDFWLIPLQHLIDVKVTGYQTVKKNMLESTTFFDIEVRADLEGIYSKD